MKLLMCWLFGCEIDFDDYYQIWSDDYFEFHRNYRCTKCGENYEYPKSQGFIRRIRGLFRKLFPLKCCECGKRYCDNDDCLPF